MCAQRPHRMLSRKGLLDELPGYAWDPDASEKGEDRPIKRDDHSVDALRYAVHSVAHEWRPLLATSTADSQLCPQGQSWER
ncbi:hypothetical protein [Streptomyces sioyaensis]|uniref:hypothetical protein n=1 Tax=Streptomyces sioyaensis TaxID=67364 RepID=UPI0036E6EA2D